MLTVSAPGHTEVLHLERVTFGVIDILAAAMLCECSTGTIVTQCTIHRQCVVQGCTSNDGVTVQLYTHT